VTFPDRAALVLESDPASHEDGLLQVREIRNLPLNADLVILSACDTGQGRLLGEEGIANLEQAFLLAGANTVIASLWGADDTYTLALMKQFYRHLALGQDKDSALRRAQIDLLAYLGNTQFRSTGRASLWWATGPGVSRLPTASRQDTKISETMNEFLERRGPIEDCHHCAKT
jgi:CHAT domain-containing protein